MVHICAHSSRAGTQLDESGMLSVPFLALANLVVESCPDTNTFFLTTDYSPGDLKHGKEECIGLDSTLNHLVIIYSVRSGLTLSTGVNESCVHRLNE